MTPSTNLSQTQEYCGTRNWSDRLNQGLNVRYISLSIFSLDSSARACQQLKAPSNDLDLTLKHFEPLSGNQVEAAIYPTGTYPWRESPRKGATRLHLRVELCLWQQRYKALQLHIREHMCSIPSKLSELCQATWARLVSARLALLA